MKCQHCGNEIPDNSTVCESCGKPVEAAPTAWYKKWWIWLIVALVVAGAAIACVFAFSGSSPKEETPTTVATEAVTEAATQAATETTATTAETVAPTELTIDQIVKQGYEKIGYVKLYNKINDYKGKKILTAVNVDDIGESALYTSVTADKKKLCFIKFVFNDPKEIKGIKKGEYVVVYGTVNSKGAVSSTIEVDDCHIAAKDKAAKEFFNSIKDEKPVVPTAKPTTKPTAKPTTAPTAKPTTAPAPKPTSAPETTPEPDPTSGPETTSEGHLIISDEKGITVSYIDTSYDYELEAAIIKIHIENNSGKDVFIGAEDSTVNGKNIDLLAVDYFSAGESADSEMLILQYDLDELGITDIEELKFKLIYEDPEDWDNPEITDFIIIKP